MLDIVIKGGILVDGSGAPPRAGEIGIVRDRIALVENMVAAEAVRTIDAQGMVVTPGFIDIHSHADFTLPVLPTADSKVHQGVTLEVVGNCGTSPAPVDDCSREELKRTVVLSGGAQLKWNWDTFESFLGVLQQQRVSVNVAAMVGHGAIRTLVMGTRDTAPTPEQLDEMKTQVRRALDGGAIGLSTGLIYPPGVYANTDEIVELVRVVAETGGLYASHIRGEGDTLLQAIAEAITIGRRAHVPVEVSHLKAAGRQNWHKMSLAIEMIEAARADGIEVSADMYPYTAGSTSLTALLPDWAHVDGRVALLKRLQSHEDCCRIRRCLSGPGMSRDAGWDGIYISFCPSHPECEGRSIRELAAERGQAPEEAVIEVLREVEGRAEIVAFMMNEENVALGLSCPFVMIGTDGEGRSTSGPLSVGKPHPRNYGTFPRVLGQFVREKGTLSLEKAIHKMTGLQAAKLRLRKRGLLQPGYYADLVIFDPQAVTDTATYQRPHQYPLGIPWVLVNGQPVIAQGHHTGLRPGQLITR